MFFRTLSATVPYFTLLHSYYLQATFTYYVIYNLELRHCPCNGHSTGELCTILSLSLYCYRSHWSCRLLCFSIPEIIERYKLINSLRNLYRFIESTRRENGCRNKRGVMAVEIL